MLRRGYVGSDPPSIKSILRPVSANLGGHVGGPGYLRAALISLIFGGSEGCEGKCRGNLIGFGPRSAPTAIRSDLLDRENRVVRPVRTLPYGQPHAYGSELRHDPAEAIG